MATIVKQNVGIDQSMKNFKAAFAQLDSEQCGKIKSSKSFDNNTSGFKRLLEWADKLKVEGAQLCFTVEATGVYYEDLAHHLHEQGVQLSVLLPNTVKAYALSLNVKTKTDSVDAEVLARMGLERALPAWQPASPAVRQLKKLSRERATLQQERTAVANRLHAEEHSHRPEKAILQRCRKRVQLLSKQIKEIEKQLRDSVAKDAVLKEKVKKACSIKGVGIVTAVSVIAETNGFALFRNKAQLVSYAGYDVVERQSGTSILGKTKISKKGNSFIRAALHFPALTAVRHDTNMKALYDRVFERTRIKMKGAVAVQRKLLVLIYTLVKKDEMYDPNFQTKQSLEEALA